MSHNQYYIISNLRKYRKLTDLTLAQFSELTGLTITSLSHWERGDRFPNMHKAVVIINALNEKLRKMKNFGFPVKPDLTFDKIWEIKYNKSFEKDAIKTGG